MNVIMKVDRIMSLVAFVDAMALVALFGEV